MLLLPWVHEELRIWESATRETPALKVEPLNHSSYPSLQGKAEAPGRLQRRATVLGSGDLVSYIPNLRSEPPVLVL